MRLNMHVVCYTVLRNKDYRAIKFNNKGKTYPMAMVPVYDSKPTEYVNSLDELKTWAKEKGYT